MKPKDAVEQRHWDLGDFAPPEGEIRAADEVRIAEDETDAADLFADTDRENDAALGKDADPMAPAKPPFGEDADLPPKPGNPEERSPDQEGERSSYKPDMGSKTDFRNPGTPEKGIPGKPIPDMDPPGQDAP